MTDFTKEIISSRRRRGNATRVLETLVQHGWICAGYTNVCFRGPDHDVLFLWNKDKPGLMIESCCGIDVWSHYKNLDLEEVPNAKWAKTPHCIDDLY